MSSDHPRADGDPDSRLRGALERVADRRAVWEVRSRQGLPVDTRPPGNAPDVDDPLRAALERLLLERLAQVPEQSLPQRCEACNEPFGNHASVLRLEPHDLDDIGLTIERPMEYFFCRRCAQQTRALVEWQRRETR